MPDDQSPGKPTIVQLFITCLLDVFSPQTGMAVVNILERLGITVQFPFNQTCCGQPAFNGGLTDDAQAMARHTLDVLFPTQGPIVIPSGSCAAMMIHHYPHLFANNPDYQSQAIAVAGRVVEFTHFLVDVLGVTNVNAVGSGIATYHASCHGLRHLGLINQAKTLLANIDGLTTVPLPTETECCGFGGLFAIKMSGISGAMLAKKLDSIEASGTDTLVGSDFSCLMHIAGGLQKRGSSIRVKHIADLLDNSPSSKADP